MLQSLISSQSIEKILFFLLLNGKCYASQLSKRFKSPLTPIQLALAKLEKGGILTSHTEGKTRFFEFDSHYPLLSELESLLKKAYTHLDPEQKKLFYSPAFTLKPHRKERGVGPQTVTGQKTLQLIWDKLNKIQNLTFSAKSKSLGSITGWNGIGRGHVEVKKLMERVIVFHERGTWVSEDHKEFEFSNVFRWTWLGEQGSILLEHLRFGAQNPVLLFSLVPIGPHTLESLESHMCNQDAYFGQLRYDKHFIQFNWRVIGPNKNEEIDYLYT